MARYRRYRRTIVKAPKKKWGSNMISIDVNLTNTNVSTDPQTPHYILYGGTSLAVNKTETTSPTPVIIKTGNFKAQLDPWGNLSTLAPLMVYIIYVPEGFTMTATTAVSMIKAHPEWVMAWRVGDSSNFYPSQGAHEIDFTRINLSSRLKRNLNSGDSIYLVAFIDGAGATDSMHLGGMIQFWTCAN